MKQKCSVTRKKGKKRTEGKEKKEGKRGSGKIAI